MTILSPKQEAVATQDNSDDGSRMLTDRSAHPIRPQFFSRARFSFALLLVFAATGCLATMSRKGWNDSGDHQVIGEKAFSAEEMAWLRASTTIVFLPRAELPHRDYYQTALSRAWTLTPIKVVSYDERAEYLDHARYSYLTLAGVTKSVRMGPTTNHYTHIFLKLMRVTGIENGNPVGINYSRIDLLPDYATVMTLRTLARQNQDAVAAAYDRGVFRNFNPATLGLYLRSVQMDLEAGRRRWAYEELDDRVRREPLRNATLYIPDYALFKFDPFTAEENETYNPADLLSRYRGRYQIVSVAELNRLYAEGPGPVFVLDFVRSGSDKFVAIHERQAGLIYRAYESSSYNLDPEDFELF